MLLGDIHFCPRGRHKSLSFRHVCSASAQNRSAPASQLLVVRWLNLLKEMLVSGRQQASNNTRGWPSRMTSVDQSTNRSDHYISYSRYYLFRPQIFRPLLSALIKMAKQFLSRAGWKHYVRKISENQTWARGETIKEVMAERKANETGKKFLCFCFARSRNALYQQMSVAADVKESRCSWS